VSARVPRHCAGIRRLAIAVQETLSTYLFAYVFIMLWHGALSDALGRRLVVLVSLAIYAFASLGCAIAITARRRSV